MLEEDRLVWRRYAKRLPPDRRARADRWLRDFEADRLITSTYQLLHRQKHGQALRQLLKHLRLLPHTKPPRLFAGALLRTLLLRPPPRWFTEKSRLNLCIVSTEFPPEPHGGTGSSYHDLAHGLAGAGHSASVIARSALGLERKIHVEQQAPSKSRDCPELRQSRARGSAVWLERRQILRAMRRLHAKKAFTHIEASDYDGLLSHGGLRGLPAIVRIRGSNLFFDTVLERAPQLYEHAQERAALQRATHLASVSLYAAEKTLALCGMSNRPCTILPNGVDTELFSPDPTVKPQPGLVVYVNSLNPKKGIEQLIDACNATFPSRPGTKLAVIGQDTQRHLGGAYLVGLRERVHPALRDRVEFLGGCREEVSLNGCVAPPLHATHRTWKPSASQRWKRCR
jgi:hypothetical protein